MKLWENAMNEISPDLIAGAMEYEKAAVKPRAAKSLRKKWIPAACLLLGLVLIGGGLLLFPKRESREGRPDGETAQEPLTLPSSSDAPTEAYPAGSDTPPEVLPTITEKLDDYSEIWKADRQWEEGIETFGASYHTEILDGPFAGYQSSYVCEEALIGEKLGEAALNGRWYYIGTHGVLQEQWNPFEDLQAEVFAIRGLSPDAAVALRFSQAGSVLTTDHYYTYLNPKTELPRLSVFFTGSQAEERLTKSGGQATLEVEKASAQAVTRSYYNTDESAAGTVAKALLALDGPAAEDISEETILVHCEKRASFSIRIDGIGQWGITVYDNGYLRLSLSGTDVGLFSDGFSRFFEIGADAAEDLIRLLEQVGTPYVREEGSTVTATTSDARPE